MLWQGLLHSPSLGAVSSINLSPLLFLVVLVWGFALTKTPALNTLMYRGSRSCRAENLVSCVVLDRLALTCFPSTLHDCVCLLTRLVISFLLILAKVQSAAQLHARRGGGPTHHASHVVVLLYFNQNFTTPCHYLATVGMEATGFADSSCLCRVRARLFGTRVGPL